MSYNNIADVPDDAIQAIIRFEYYMKALFIQIEVFS